MTASGTVLLWTAALVAVVAFAVGAGACRSYVVHPIDCDKVLQLRLGQSQEQVRQLLGEPNSIDPRLIPLNDMTPADTQWSYETYNGLFHELVPNLDDRLKVAFLDGRLVQVSGYQILRVFGGRGGPREALSLRYSSTGPDRQEIREIGPAFDWVFTCGPSFSLDAIPSREVRPVPVAKTAP